jgi:hypothetical protein
MSFNAARITKQARVQACLELLPAHITAVAAEYGITLAQLSDDPLTESGKAIYTSERTTYASHCIEIAPVEGDTPQSGGARLSELRGDVILAFQTTEPDVGPLQDAYLAALVRTFSGKRDGPNEYWQVEGVSQSPSGKTKDGPLIAAVSVTVLHQIAEDL